MTLTYPIRTLHKSDKSREMPTKKIRKTRAVPSKISSRRRMPSRLFAVPETRSYPIPDEYHAELALTSLLRVAGRHGTDSEKRRAARAVLKIVRHKFPRIYQREHEVVAKIHEQYDL